MEFDGAIFLMSKMFLDRKKGILEHAQDVVNILTFGNFLDASNFLKKENCCTEICINKFLVTGRNRQQQLQSKDWRFLTCIKQYQKNNVPPHLKRCGLNG